LSDNSLRTRKRGGKESKKRAVKSNREKVKRKVNLKGKWKGGERKTLPGSALDGNTSSISTR